ncbi:MAG: bifunctional [glutamine synthetase] adenylyltransferase/[glutamine synthetase]-adenylyl-L-tyrosine phosphorylase [Pseudomonadota bacterium]
MLQVSALSSDPQAAIEIAAQHAPYLSSLVKRTTQADAPESLLQEAHALCDAVILGETDPKSALRQAKLRAHLAITAMDVSGHSSVPETTEMITRFADAATTAALCAARRDLDAEGAGLFIVALGKMGAFELNYSSDIDIAAFYDPDLFQAGPRGLDDTAVRIIRRMIGYLSDRTPDGYVFRTDLRLRPDPSSTPLAVSTRRAALYYESVGQNWERMVWIKGRIAAGDHAAGERFVSALDPFIWRRHLDYWAIADVHAIKNMINSKVGEISLSDPAADLKLGPGGIREIEFFVQTQQIIFGGRHPDLRVRGTLEGLQRLVALGTVTSETARELSEAYLALRAVEHRIQMIDDEQTHTLPDFDAKREHVAALCGYNDLQQFDADIAATRRCVNAHFHALFADEARRHAKAVEGNLVFTGVDDDPATIETLRHLGFKAPSETIERVRHWHRGRTPATRTTRGRELLTAILPDLLAAMGRTGEADEAFRRFSRFFEGLRSGVQVLAMLVANTDLMEDLVTTLALAPRIADILARRPGLLEALVSTGDRKPEPTLTPGMDFETLMNTVRHWHGERAFLTGHQLLHGQIHAVDAAADWSALADTSVELMAAAAEAETQRRFGPAPGQWLVVGLGKLGGREMTAGSDLDILVIYEPAPGAENVQAWFTRFTQRLIAGLSAETAEGFLYEVDMRLRPSGRAGPVATSIKAFESYHGRDAWTWEHMALTRLRSISGSSELAARVTAIAEQAIQVGDAGTRTDDILEMRKRLFRDKPAAGDWDLKMRAGGLIDIEFITQHAILTAQIAQSLCPELRAAHQQLRDSGVWTADEYDVIAQAFSLLQSLQQVQRVAHAGAMVEADLSIALKDRLCRATGCDGFDALSERLKQTCQDVSAVFCKKIGNPATETRGSSV